MLNETTCTFYSIYLKDIMSSFTGGKLTVGNFTVGKMKHLRQHMKILLLFIGIDQVIKIIIWKFYFNDILTIIEGIFKFNPIINKKLSWGGNYISLLSNPFIIITINIIVILFYITAYSYYRSEIEVKMVLVDVLFVTGLAGSICSLIDKIFWGGSLDYIQFFNLFIFDLKDCYLTCSQLLIVYLGIKYNEHIKVRDYLKFCFYLKK